MKGIYEMSGAMICPSACLIDSEYFNKILKIKSFNTASREQYFR